MFKGELPDRYFTKKKDIKKISDILDNLPLKKIKKKKRSLDVYQDFWDRNIDDSIRKHGKVSDFKNGILFIEVDSHSWLHHITNFCKNDILSSYQNYENINFISDIKFILSK